MSHFYPAIWVKNETKMDMSNFYPIQWNHQWGSKISSIIIFKMLFYANYG